ncbi:hypothetical protein MTR_1g057140 [Medicago truncatula]|uniref:Uncharacterized protein n=1 Tax=Medicago truncatula TaxID=3880 RepID=A0A072VJY5_MEDTR|nr:hypothetical protein MTR_1g057140 [Medicago truncatula]
MGLKLIRVKDSQVTRGGKETHDISFLYQERRGLVEVVNADIGVLVKSLNAEGYLKIRHNQRANILEIRVQNQNIC